MGYLKQIFFIFPRNQEDDSHEKSSPTFLEK